jgi:hypothetical protein
LHPQLRRHNFYAMDWQSWHNKYDLPDSPMERRLKTVQTQIRNALDSCPPGPLKVVSMCAGQARDLLPVLAHHPRRDDVQAQLVELDERNVALAAEGARAAGLNQVDVIAADASLIDHYRGMAPAHLVLMCGLFGNITDDDIRRAIEACSQLCRTGGVVIWTRHRRSPDRVPLICEWFEKRGFDQQWLSEQDPDFGVGVHRFTGEPQPLVQGTRMFTFVGYDVLRQSHSPETS